MPSRITQAPSKYDGTLGELYDRWAKSVLLAPSIVEEFHTQFCAYLKSADPLFLVRQVTGTERRENRRIENGAQLRPTDNAPAWWIHYQLFSEQFRKHASFAAFIDAIPCHMFDVHVPAEMSINKAGWHVAHIFNVKDSNVRFQHWDRNELVRRAARNIHPCNYFYVPKCDWQRYGGNSTVVAFFYDKFRSVYETIWKDFLRLVDGTPPHMPTDADTYRYTFPEVHASQPPAQQIGRSQFAREYSHSRLCFKAEIIEPLSMNDRFCIVSNDGVFAMTKREFYDNFPNVVASVSYTRDKIYHYKQPPQKALRFKISR